MTDKDFNRKRKYIGNMQIYTEGREVGFGDAINMPAKSISNLYKATVCGDIVKIDVIEAKSAKKKLLRFDITDYASTVTVKLTDKNEIIDSLAEKLKNAKTVMVEGSYIASKFGEGYILPKNIQTVIKAEKEDDAPEKRVELHLHTTYSEMNGVTSPSAYIERAAKWGHKAIAITDFASVQGLPEAYDAAKKVGIKLILGMEGYLVDDEKYPEYLNMKSEAFQYHNIILLVKEDNSFDSSVPEENRKYGRKNLYELISHSYVKTFHSKPLIPKSLLSEKRDGLLIGASCEQGELLRAVLDGTNQAEIERIAEFYDYIEISASRDEKRIDINKRIIEIADKRNKPVVAVGNVYYLDGHEWIFRDIISGLRKTDLSKDRTLYFKTTDEMLSGFKWAGDRAEEFVIENPNKIADMIMDDISPIPEGYFPIKIENAAEELRTVCSDKAHEFYGEVLPDEVSSRLNDELHAIIQHGFEDQFVLAMKAVEDSERHGYHVMARGSVGASFVAYLCGITGINPLAPHYICEKCKHTEFISDGSVKSGFDLSAKRCPHCNAPMKRDGHDIPYESFLGFNGDKMPDIDLNFSGEYQASSHRFVEDIFGKDHVVKSGIIRTVFPKMAEGFLYGYLEEQKLPKETPKAEIDRLVDGCIGVKRAVGQHPGKLVIIPKKYTLEDFTPIQYRSGYEYTGSLVTHFSYNDTLNNTLFNIDFLAHDFPTMIRKLEESTGVKLSDIDLHDPKLYELLTSCEPLGVKAEAIDCPTGTRAILELGTPFVLEMLVKTLPKSFFDLVQISGLSHGTDVWLNNAEELIENGECTVTDVIACREDIFTYLLRKCDSYEKETGEKSPLSRKDCFDIMEFTRRGRGQAELQKYADALRKIGVEEWYIDSCRKIKYMFPKAHAVSYVISALQALWYKLYYPQEFYNAFFKIHYGDKAYLSFVSMIKDEIKQEIEEIRKKKKLDYHIELYLAELQLALEMLERGCKFEMD